MTGLEEDPEHGQRLLAAMFPSPLEEGIAKIKVSQWEMAETLVGRGHYRLARVVDWVGDMHDILEIRLQHRRVRRGRWGAYIPEKIKR